MNYYRNILVVASVAIFYTGVPWYVNSVLPEAAPMYWVILLFLLSLPLLSSGVVGAEILKSPLMVWCFGFAWLSLIGFFISSQSAQSWDEVRLRCLTIIELLMFLSLFASANAHRLARQALIPAVLFGVALNIYELFAPLSFSRYPGRSSGLYLDPNIAGGALVFGMIFGVTVLPSRYAAPFMLLTGSGVFVTVSRGAILAWLTAVAGMMLMSRVRVKDLLQSVAVSLLLVVLVLLPQWDQLLTTLERGGAINKDVLERMEWFGDPTGVSDISSSGRKLLAERAWEKIADHPFLGSGTGSSTEAFVLPHNQYLALMQDHGVIAAAILPLLILAVAWRARGESMFLAMVFGSTLLLLGFFSHTLLNENHALLLLGLMAAIAATSRENAVRNTGALATGKVGTPKALAKA